MKCLLTHAVFQDVTAAKLRIVKTKLLIYIYRVSQEERT